MNEPDAADPPPLFDAARIRQAVTLAAVIEPVREALIAFSRGRAVVPPIGLIDLPGPGEAHVKSGYLRGGDIFLVKIATMVPGNRRLGMDTSHHTPIRPVPRHTERRSRTCELSLIAA